MKFLIQISGLYLPCVYLPVIIGFLEFGISSLEFIFQILKTKTKWHDL